jgi:hypothetical protein
MRPDAMQEGGVDKATREGRAQGRQAARKVGRREPAREHRGDAQGKEEKQRKRGRRCEEAKNRRQTTENLWYGRGFVWGEEEG